ncbi:hypothetical protein CKA32_004060 [Geitlerinema sp. FC II]|nr:hypothetical protein CKA32_000267 [Geitlerinema sp. FC II]PPT07966.1 hypothetical protein CKA32_004060 [Geitlerinema sp. FC II]
MYLLFCCVAWQYEAGFCFSASSLSVDALIGVAVGEFDGLTSSSQGFRLFLRHSLPQKF